MNLWSSLRDMSSRNVRRAGAAVTAVAVGLALTAGCLNRPVVQQDPQTSNVFVDQIRQTAIDKIDLLFVIDNSISMADKQAILSVAVPGLVERLVNPDCVQVDAEGEVIARTPARATGEPCDEGWDVEFNPVDDIHIGVVTSSLGGHGGDICSPDGSGAGSWNETKNDRGRLLPTVRPDLNLPSSDAAGFLAWDPANTTREQLKADFQQHVQGAGEIGCGYEATLEAWYRFLIDPSPPLDMVTIDQDGDGKMDVAVPAQDGNGIIVDNTVLEQRNAFLRADSLVAVIVLTDENDCSVVDGGIGWLTASATFNGNSFNMPAATTACDTNPNDKCCRSCGLTSNVDGCAPLDQDANCQAGRDGSMDALNLRCWNQKQRFGFDLLYPIERYVAALRDPQIYDTHRCDASGNCPLVQNPLFDVRDASSPRDQSLVFLAGIVGVPWQDIANDASLADATRLEYLSAPELSATGRWDLILGHPEADNPAAEASLPVDPLMREQSNPRSGSHPITGEAVAPETSTDPGANSINGHEYKNTDNGDLQYACIFPLSTVRDCSDTANMACDCAETDIPKNRPLCNPPGGGDAGLNQYSAKAYPGLRLLQTLRDFGDNSIVASICPKVTDPGQVPGGESDAAFGYNPAVAAIIDRLKEVLGGRCLPRQLVPNEETNLVPCAVVEATQTPNDCNPALGRGPVDPDVVPAVHKQLEASGSCGGATPIRCDSYNLCEIKQLTGDPQQQCLNQTDYPASSVPGYCYIDAAQGIGDESLLVGCPATEQRKLRFVGENTPASGSITFIACVGAAFTDEKGDPTMP